MNTSICSAKNLLVMGLAIVLGIAFQSCGKNDEPEIVTPPDNGYCYETVDLGLSVLWGTCNIGSETQGGKGNLYSWEDILEMENLVMENLGMRLPTKDEWEELLNSELVSWEKINPRNFTEIDGYSVTNKATGKSIFLAVNGCKNFDSGEVSYPNQFGFYWSSTPESGNCMYTLKLQNYGPTICTNDRKEGLSVRFVKDFDYKPKGALSGVFTVGKGADGIAGTDDDVKIRFSKGNLYAKKEDSKWTWNFYDEQYSYNSLNSECDEYGIRIAKDNDTEIDLFTWGNDATESINPIGEGFVEGHLIDGEAFSKNEDWGYVFGCELSAWRTLTIAEWQYLFAFHHDSDSPRYGLFKCGVTVCDKVNCVVIAPDDWDLTVNPLQDSYGPTSTPMTWDQAEAAGLVCLPAVGSRQGWYVDRVGEEGEYWSSSAFAYDEPTAYYVDFISDGVYPACITFRKYGFAVRLVTDCQ